MTAITMPLTSQDEKDVSQTHKTKGCSLWVIAVLISMLTLLVFAGFVLFATVSCIAPSCDLPVHDLDFKAHGRLGDNDFDDDFHYDHEHNVLVKKTTGQGSMDNTTITVLHDFKRGFTTYVIPSQKKCFLGVLESDSYDMLLHANNGGFMELSNPMGHQYLSHGIISPSYLERTASSLVVNRCSGLETSWIEPSIEGASIQKRGAIRNGPGDIMIKTSDGTVIIIKR
eukprot:XP_003725604.1 PREDICTED: uncharacterized protein LOC100894104 [Strongylocentrotus purpuratus]